MLLASRRPRLVTGRRKAPPPRAVGYYDRVDASDHNNRECFVYCLGRYGNRSIYCVGETNDLHATEFLLKRTFPVYTKVRSVPAEEAKRFKSRMCCGEIKQVQPNEILAPALADGLADMDFMFLQVPDDGVFRKVLEEEITKKMS